MTSFRLQTLGDVRLFAGADELLAGRRKDLTLLALLAVRAPRRVARAELAALLWEDADEARAQLSLRQGLLKLRRTLPEALEVDATSTAVRAEALALDVRMFEGDVAAGRFAEAVARWNGDFLAGADSSGGEDFRLWLEGERERLRRLLDWALSALVSAARQGGAHREAVTWAQRWVELRPTEAAAHRALVDALQASGRTAEALAHHGAHGATLSLAGDDAGAEWRALGDALAREAPRPADPAVGSAALFTPDLVGRGAVLAELQRLWYSVAQHGAGAAVIVEGEEGLGVTRVVESLATAIDSGIVLRCRAHAGERGIPHAAAADLLAGLRDAPGVAGAPGAALGTLAEIAPWLRERFRGVEPASVDAGVTVAGALSQVIAAVAEEQPVLVWIDDVAEIDDASRRVALHLATRPLAGALIVLGARVEAAERVPELAALRRDAHVRRLRLQPLTAQEVESLVGSMLSMEHDESAGLIARIAAESGGNPLYAVQMVSALVDEGHLVGAPGGRWRLANLSAVATLPIPSTVREAVQRRIARLREPARALLDIAAVLAEPFDSAQVARVSGMDAADVQHATADLLERRLVRETAGAEGAPRYEIAQGLTRRVAWEQLPAGRRREIAERLQGGRGDSGGVGAAPGQRSWGARSWRLAAAVVGVLALGAVGITRAWRARHDAPTLAPNLVAVFPFTVRGGTPLDYLREGLVDLVATALDGAGDLASVDPHATLGGDSSAAPGERAARIGAGLYVTGSAVETSAGVQLTATLHRTAGPDTPLARVSATGDPAALIALVDTIARGIMVAGGSNGELGGLAAASTSSLPALKRFLEGEAAFRRGAYTAAVDAFQRATSIDSAFALAYYRESVAAEWVLPPSEPPKLAEQAWAHRERLAPRTRTLLDALRASRAGDFHLAEQRLRLLTIEHPNDAEAWFELGEVLNHHGQFFGTPAVAAKPAFGRALQLDPGDIHSIVHLARLAAMEGRRATLDSLLRRGEGLGSQSERPAELALLRGFVWEDTSLQRAVAERIRHDQSDVTNPVWNTAVYAENLPGAERLSQLFLEPARGSGWNAVGQRYIAMIRAGEGRPRAAEEALSRYAAFDSAAALEYRAWVALLPPARPAPASPGLASLARALEAWHPRRPARVDPEDFLSVHDTIHGMLRAYLRGRVALARGDRRTLDASIAELAQSAARPFTLGTALLHGLRAHAFAAAGDTSRALAELDSATMHVWHAWRYRSAFYAQPHDRWLRAELLHGTGRDEEALPWYESFDGGTMYDLPFLAISHQRRGEIMAKRGDCGAARQHAAHAARLWRDAEPAESAWLGARPAGNC